MLNALVAACCLFNPPDQWELSHPKSPSRHAICGFLEKGQSGFRPSIHLTHEVITCSENEYLREIEQNAKRHRQKWRNMGTISTASGKAYLIQLEVNARLGKVSLLQAILIRGNEAHILTAGALKKDLSRLAPIFKKAFSSMEAVDNLFEKAHDPIALRAAWQKRGEDLESYTKMVMEQSALGPVGKIQLMRLQ